MSADTTDFQTGTAKAGMSRVAKITTALLFVAWLVDYFDRLIMNIALPDIGKDFGINHAQQGLIVSVFFFAYAFSQLPGGVLADKLGTRKVIAVAMIFWSLFTGFTALAWTFSALLVIRALFGIGEGVFPGASFKAITERTSPQERMLANGIMLSSNNFGGAVAPLVAIPLIAAVGWRWGFGISAFAGVIVLGLIAMYLPGKTEASEVAEASPVAQKVNGWAVLKCPHMYFFVAMFFGIDIIAWGLNTWMPSYLQDARHLSLSESAFLLALPPVVAGIATIIGGKLADRLGGRPRLIVAPAMLVGGIGIYLMAESASLTDFMIWQCVGLFCFGLSFMPVMAVPIKTLNGQFTGSASGMINFGGQLAGVVAPFVMGWLIDTFHTYTAAFMFLVAGAAIAFLMAMIAPQTPEALKQRLSRNPQLAGGFADEITAGSAAR